jgi:phage-related tail fiber protein
MTKKILVSYDFSQNEIQNAKAQNLAADPSTPATGQFWYNTTTGKMMWRGNVANIDPTARANHTGTQLAATISDFSASVQAIRLDQHAAPTAAVAMNNQRLTGLAEPTAAQDAATKNYVDAAVNGTDWKQSVRAATTANITLSGLQTIDGISVAAGERVLVKNQTNATENGLFNAASGAWSRTTDADQNVEVTAGLTVMVEEGTTQADSQWRLTTDGAITVGTTSLTFAQIGAGTAYTAGAGISIAGNVVAIDTGVVVRKFAATVGGATSIAVTHALNTTDVQVQCYLVSTNELIECDVVRTNATTVTLGFAVAPAANSIRVSIQG